MRYDIAEQLAAGDASRFVIQFAAQLFTEKAVSDFLGLVEPIAAGRDLQGLAVLEILEVVSVAALEK